MSGYVITLKDTHGKEFYDDVYSQMEEEYEEIEEPHVGLKIALMAKYGLVPNLDLGMWS